ncbi:DUF6241 domain-containing protein [Terrilactibacillus laevilacticus]|uniref:DUF6241 domain-containing protein n=2 Tax=Terrilactibacillus laevilacticus TaxID=1380157 RepID=A0ABW5PUX4_9BACI
MLKKVILIAGTVLVIGGVSYFIHNAYEEKHQTQDKEVTQKVTVVTHTDSNSEKGIEKEAIDNENKKRMKEYFEKLKRDAEKVTPEDIAFKKWEEGMKTDPERTSRIGIDGFQYPNPFGEKTVNRGLVTDEIAQKYLEKMISNKKEMTKARIDWMSSAIHLNKQMLKHKEVYKEILNRWKNGDFSKLASENKQIKGLVNE